MNELVISRARLMAQAHFDRVLVDDLPYDPQGVISVRKEYVGDDAGARLLVDITRFLDPQELRAIERRFVGIHDMRSADSFQWQAKSCGLAGDAVAVWGAKIGVLAATGNPGRCVAHFDFTGAVRALISALV